MCITWNILCFMNKTTCFCMYVKPVPALSYSILPWWSVQAWRRWVQPSSGEFRSLPSHTESCQLQDLLLLVVPRVCCPAHLPLALLPSVCDLWRNTQKWIISTSCSCYIFSHMSNLKSNLLNKGQSNKHGPNLYNSIIKLFQAHTYLPIMNSSLMSDNLSVTLKITLITWNTGNHPVFFLQ